MPVVFGLGIVDRIREKPLDPIGNDERAHRRASVLVLDEEDDVDRGQNVEQNVHGVAEADILCSLAV